MNIFDAALDPTRGPMKITVNTFDLDGYPVEIVFENLQVDSQDFINLEPEEEEITIEGDDHPIVTTTSILYLNLRVEARVPMGLGTHIYRVTRMGKFSS